LLDRQEADLRRDLDNRDLQIVNTGDRLIVTLPQDILFATDSTTVRADLRRDLQALAGNLQAYPKSSVSIIGHTDNVGDASYNRDLSNRRAYSVESVLVDSGISNSRIQAYGRGEQDPLASNLTSEGRAQNRRVDVVIVSNAG
jgi:outer membrane protein OmpA-like peptidoglycan-associated protein